MVGDGSGNPRTTGYGKQLSGWYPQTVVGREKKVGWGPELCHLGREFPGCGPVLSVRDPTDKIILEIQGMWILIFFIAFSKNVVSSKTSCFRPLPIGAVRTENT